MITLPIYPPTLSKMSLVRLHKLASDLASHFVICQWLQHWTGVELCRRRVLELIDADQADCAPPEVQLLPYPDLSNHELSEALGCISAMPEAFDDVADVSLLDMLGKLHDALTQIACYRLEHYA